MSVASLNVCTNHSCWIAIEGSIALCRFSFIQYEAAGLGSNLASVGIFISTYKLWASVSLDKLLWSAVFSWLYRLIALSTSAECAVQAAILANTMHKVLNSFTLEKYSTNSNNDNDFNAGIFWYQHTLPINRAMKGQLQSFHE